MEEKSEDFNINIYNRKEPDLEFSPITELNSMYTN